MAKDVFPLQVQNGSGLSFPWREVVPENGHEETGETSWGYDDSRAVFVMDIYWKDTPLAIQQLLGYNFAALAPDVTLHRKPPWPHPVKPWLYAVSVREKAQGFQGKYSGPPGFFNSGIGWGSGPAARWLYNRLTITFSTLPFTVMDDATLTAQYGGLEFWRCLEVLPAPSASGLTRSGADFQWAETSPTGPTLGNAIGTGLSQLVSKVGLTWVWHNVPDEYVMDQKGLPANVAAAMGTVNDAPFPPLNATFTDAGKRYPAGTLLMEPPHVKPVTAPVAPGLVGALPNQPPRMWDVQLNVSYFDPPLGGQTRGHNLVPWAADNKWYLIKSSQGQTLYPSSDWTKVFAKAGT